MTTATTRWSALVILALSLNFLSGCGTPGVNQNASSSPAASTTQDNGNANAQASTNSATAGVSRSTTCTPQDDAQIVAQIRILIDGDPALKPHKNHINYSTKICQVTLRGWVDTFDTFKKLYDKVSNAGGVRSIDISGFELRPQMPTPTPGGTPVGPTLTCPEGTKMCGELCIPKDEDCTILAG